MSTHLDPPHASLGQARGDRGADGLGGPRGAHRALSSRTDSGVHRRHGGGGEGPQEVRARRGCGVRWAGGGWAVGSGARRPRGGREEAEGGSCAGGRTGASEEAGAGPGPAATLASLVPPIGAAGWCGGPRPSGDETLWLLSRGGLGSGCGRERRGRERRGGDRGLDGRGPGRDVDGHRCPGGTNRHHLVVSRTGGKGGGVLPEAKGTGPGRRGPVSRQRTAPDRAGRERGSRPGRRWPGRSSRVSLHF